MLSDTFKSARTRTTALVIAFGVVAGGVAVTAAPSFAANGDQVDASVDGGTSTASASVSEDVIAADAPTVTVTGSGFTPGNLVYVKVVGPEGQTNWSWGTESHQVDESGAVTAELSSDEAWGEGDYSVVLFESENVQASTGFAAEAPLATETPEPTETTTPEPTETATPEPTETATVTPEPTETTTPEPTETSTETPEPTLTEEPTLEPTETATVTPTATETATPEPTETEAPVADPAVATEQSSYTQEEAAEGITYVATGFTPGVELGLTLLLPDGSTAEFESAEPITPDADGNYAGIITYDAAWLVGDYGITLTTISTVAGEVTDAPAADSARAVPLIVEDESELTATTESPAAVELDAEDAPEEQTATTSFAVTGETPATVDTSPSATAAPAGNGGNGVVSTDTKGKAQTKSLATTGAEDAFSAAGIGLLVLGLGAAAVTGARFLSRRRES